MKFENKLKRFVKKIEETGTIDGKLMQKILDEATVWNKYELMKDLIFKIEVFRSYDEEKGIQFPYKSYIDKFLNE